MNRIQSVDIFRLLAITAVIAIHSKPFMADLPREDEIYKYLGLIINQTARFAVPFFFVISGYFWGLKVRNTDTPILVANEMAKKASLIFIAWSFIYLLPTNMSSAYNYGAFGPIKTVYWKMLKLGQNPVKLMMQGTRVHLWFLVGLLFSVYISALFINRQLINSLIIFSVLLYLVGVLAKAYVDTPIGIDISFNTRNGPFFGLLPFVSGFMISGIPISTRWLRYGLLISFFGLLLHFSEIYLLWKYFGTNPKQDYVIGTYFMGVGVAIVSLSNHKIFQNSRLSAIGRLSLGIYVIHFIFVDLFRGIDKTTDNPFWEVGHVFLVLGLSLTTALLMSKNRILKKIVA